MCRDCKTTIFSKKDFAASALNKPPDQRAYENLLQFEKGIRSLLPTFQRLVVALQDPEKPPSHIQLSEASKVRKRLIDSFGKYDLAAKRIRDLPTDSPTQRKLQKAIYHQAENFLHLHMLPLKSLPKILKHASPSPHSLPPPHLSSLASLKYNTLLDNDSSSQLSSSSQISQMEAEEKELREKLIVLEEQRFLTQEMVRDANKRRRWDEVGVLKESLADLEREINSVNGVLGQLDWEGVYKREVEVNGGEGRGGGLLGGVLGLGR